MKRLGVFISFSGDGGVERMVTNLCAEFVKHVKVDLLVLKGKGSHVERVPATVNRIRLKAQHAWTSIGEVAAYLEEAKPDALLVAKDRAGRAALRAGRKARTGTPVYIRLGTNLSAALERRDPFSRWLRVTPMRRLYPLATGVIAVSEGVKRDTQQVTGLPPERIHVIRNPVITQALARQAGEPPPHEWLRHKAWPVVLGMGRLTQQKDFPSLLRAFAAIQRQVPSRLILLGEGGDREALVDLAESLGVVDRLFLAGFQRNPYAWLNYADLFVLSSAWEGSPNALTEALALGIPCVSTDCPSGPREILDEGRYGPLVPVGDVSAMAQAMLATLREPLSPPMLYEAVREYRADVSAQHYLQLMGLL